MVQTPTEFIARWASSSAAERANYVSFLSELCDVIGAPRPDPTREIEDDNNYVFEKTVTFRHADGSTSFGRIDLYKRDCFVLEAKQGAMAAQAPAFQLAATPAKKKTGTAKRNSPRWDDSMVKARGQAELYARALPTEHGWPPFLVVVDVGHSIDLYSGFDRTGKLYTHFPASSSFRIPLAALDRAEVRELLRLVFTDPMALDPTKRTAAVTRELAARLAELAKSLEAAQHPAEDVAQFLMRCLFTLFAEDIGLLPQDAFLALLRKLKAHPERFQAATAELWAEMDKGKGFSAFVDGPVLRFNGGLFADPRALPLDAGQIDLLIDAAKADWKNVEPAIFGTLLERALDPGERHRLGAHYTPRAYVERLVVPTVVEPLREDWDAVRAGAMMAAAAGDKADAVKLVKGFHQQLCNTRVLDPACGTGNFLYVTMEHMKRLEGEVLQLLLDFGQSGTLEGQGFTVDPHQFLGIEVNVRAAKIAELVLWIGYLQWHFKTHGRVNPPEPIIRDFKNIENRDAVLAWDRVEPLLDEEGKPVTRWDGKTTKVHPVTGEDVPDDTAREPVMRYVSPRQAEWPKADFVVGNPPFIGNKRMRLALGDGYTEALRTAWPGVPETVDLVMYWWHKASSLLHGGLRRFGLITTNSITQTFNRGVVAEALSQRVSLVFAIPDHPWVEAASGAAVRIAMTVAMAGKCPGTLSEVIDEVTGDHGVTSITLATRVGQIHADLRSGAAVTDAGPLLANKGIAFTGMYPLGQGFVLMPEDVARATGGHGDEARVLKRFLIARDITQRDRQARVIDFWPRSAEDARRSYPNLFQWVLEHVKPQRDNDGRDSRRERWWLFAEAVPALRGALTGLDRQILVPRTAKFLSFVFASPSAAPDTSVVAIAHDDALVLGMLSSKIHRIWAHASGGTLEDRPRYQHARTFNPFPFPAPTPQQAARIRQLGEELDAHRKRQQAQHDHLTITGMYNVLEKLRSGEELNDKEKRIHADGLVSVLRQIHDDLDAAVFDAYGWPHDLTDEQIIERLVALNAERADEEKRGIVRWLRPEFQNPGGTTRTEGVNEEIDLEDGETEATVETAAKKAAWPKSAAERAAAVRQALVATGPTTAKGLATRFGGARADTVAGVLEVLVALGVAHDLADGRYAPA